MSKPISQMTDEEVLQEIETLRARRVARRDEVMKAAQEKLLKKSTPKGVRKSAEVDDVVANILRNILGDSVDTQ